LHVKFMEHTATAPHVAAILTRAGDLLARPGAWGQRAYARDRRGLRVPIDQGVRFDPVGALARVTGLHPSEVETTPAYLALEEAVGCEVPVWNDRPARTQTEVVAAFRKAAGTSRP
jgi:hypothetical protein